MSQGDSLYLQRMGSENLFQISKNTGQPEMMRVYEVESYPVPQENLHHYWARPYQFGSFILVDTPMPGCYIICHTPSGAIGVMSGDGVILQKGISGPEEE